MFASINDISNKGIGNKDDKEEFLTPDDVDRLVTRLNKRSANIVSSSSSDTKLRRTFINARHLSHLQKAPVTTNDQEAGGAAQPASNQLQAKIVNKVDEEDVYLASCLRALDATNKCGHKLETSAWSKMTEKDLDVIYKEGVSIEFTPLARSTCLNSFEHNARTLVFKINLSVIQLLQTNVAWFIKRLFADIQGLKIETKATAVIRLHDERKTHWSDMDVAYCVRPENIEECILYVKTEYPEALSSSPEMVPTNNLGVEFEVHESIAGTVNTAEESRGACCMEVYGTAGKSTRRELFMSGGGINKITSAVSGVEPSSIEAAAADDENNEFGSLLLGNHHGNETDVFTRGMKKLNDSLSGDDSGNRENGSKDYVAGDGESQFSYTDPVVFVTPNKGDEGKRLTATFTNFLNQACDDFETFVETDQAALMMANKEFYAFVLMSHPMNVYRLAISLFASVVMLRMRNVNGSNVSVQPLSNCKYEFGSGISFEPSSTANNRRAIDKTSCVCKNTCDTASWTTETHIENAVKVLGRSAFGGAGKSNRFHNCHRIIPFDFRWLDKLFESIASALEKSLESKISRNHDHLSSDVRAYDRFVKCYPSSGLHHMFCPNVLVVHRGESHKVNMKNNTLLITGRVNNQPQVTTCQTANLQAAFKHLENVRLRTGDEQISDIAGRQSPTAPTGIKNYMEEVADLGFKITRLAKSLHEMCSRSLPMQCISNLVVFAPKLVEFMRMLRNLVNIKCFDKAIEAYETTTTSETEEKKESKLRKMALIVAKSFATFALENQNAAFSTAINKRGYHSIIYRIRGIRFTGNASFENVQVHQFSISVLSSVVFGDYFSRAKTSESNKGFLSQEFGGVSAIDSSSIIKKAEEKEDMVMFKLFAKDIGDDDDILDSTDADGITSEESLKRKIEDASCDDDERKRLKGEKDGWKQGEEDENGDDGGGGGDSNAASDDDGDFLNCA